jgi:hypothetical protein
VECGESTGRGTHGNHATRLKALEMFGENFFHREKILACFRQAAEIPSSMGVPQEHPFRRESTREFSKFINGDRDRAKKSPEGDQQRVRLRVFLQENRGSIVGKRIQILLRRRPDSIF